MTDSAAPSYLDRLQTADREQSMIQLRTLLMQHRQSLARLPKLAAELQGLLTATDAVDVHALAGKMQTALAQANEFLLSLDMAPIDYPDHPELVSLGEKLCPLLNSASVVAVIGHFAQARDGAKQVAKATQIEQAVLDRRAAAKALGFMDHGDGTVTDTHHRLMWRQCAEGQSGTDCHGKPGEFKWDVAMQIPRTLNLFDGFAGHRNWRLPTKDELASLVMHGRTSPAICTEAFPNAPSITFWSSSLALSYIAWHVDFGNGDVHGTHRNGTCAVRLVRASLW